MPSAPPVTSCAEHRRREATAQCSVCGSPLCGDCVVPTPVGLKCRRCTGAAGSQPRRLSRRRVAALMAVAGVLLAAVAGYGLVTDDGKERPSAGEGRSALDVTGERRVRFDGAGGLPLSGTLTIPEAAGARPVPGVLVLPGLGPTTREGPVRSGSTDPLYRDVSRTLAESGLATLRYDKRGTGETPLLANQPLRFDDLVGDARAALAFLGERAEIGDRPLAVVGHEEGALVALRLAEDPRVDSLVLISAPGRPLVDVIADDFASAQGQASADAVRRVVEQLTATGSLPSREAMRPEHRDFFPEAHVAYLRDLFSLDPASEAAKVSDPVLIVRGARATGVSAADSDRLAAALGANAEVVVAPDAGHTLALDAPTPPAAAPSRDGGGHDHGSGSSAPPEVRRDADALNRIAAWLAARLGAPPGGG